MNMKEQFSRARLATIVVGTSMLHFVFEKLKDDFCVHRRIKEKLKVKKFDPLSMNFMDLFDLCTMDLVKKIYPSTNWNDSPVPQDVSLGDDIKRIKVLLNMFSETESELLRYRERHDDICKTLSDIIKRFLISERVDFSRIFQNIMHGFNIDEVNSDLDIILCGGILAPNLQKYKGASEKSETCRNQEQNEKSYPGHRVDITKQERPSEVIKATGHLSIDESPKWDSHTHKEMSVIYEKMPSREPPDIKVGRTLSYSPGKRISTLLRKQIFFDFVPPPLNYFEYTMNELSNIEKSLKRSMEPGCLKPMVSKYMSFTLIYGNHMDVSKASLALFDAEPEEKDDGSNKSGINVVYLDKDMTFEMLEEISRNQTLPMLTNEHVCLAVHSGQLLQDRNKLRKIMKQLFGRRLRVLDANRDMKIIYDRFTKLSIRVIKIVESLCQDSNERDNSSANLPDLKERLSKLRRLNTPPEVKGITKPSLKIRKALSRLKEKGLLGYTTENNNTLILCVQSSSNPLSKDRIPKIIKDEFKSIKINEMEKLFTLHHEITSGQKLHPERGNAISYGTLGMIGSFHSKTGENPTRCCISSPHVVSAGQIAYFMDATMKLGTCIWPPPVPNYEVNVEDISIITLETKDMEISKLFDEVNIFNEADRHRLDKRKVFKYGGRTGETFGFVCKTDFHMVFNNSLINVFLIEPSDNSNNASLFSKPGDSGAVVLTKFGRRIEAFSMIFGGDVNFVGVAKNNSIAVELKHAVNKFERANDKILELDTL